MINVTILSDRVREMKGVGKTSGKPYHLAFQDAYFYVCGPDGKPNELPDRAEIILEKDEFTGKHIVHAPGKYVLHPSSIAVGRDGLQITPKLVPVGTGKPAA
jgi:hypothetical protein